ncbi:MAG: phage tail protein [Chloroflexi bacterium]|uniref:Phage tail protein n=1 Tax=Candidatus Chlorohelix allophototropha TaxID=3003348 RepID=A0A8T7LXF7_9CHLR|nr:phage tail protein [Chloroflexota bacterium]WJW67430.1 phage tail protein [Chloroflexota bacterium L227-S17]
MAEKHSSELIGASSFYLDLRSGPQISLKEVSGLESETEVRELMQSTKDGKVIIIKSQGATPVKPGKLTIKYAAYKGDPVLDWRQLVVNGKMEEARRDIHIVIYGVDNKEIMRFTCKNSWPSKYAWSNLSAKSNEALEITVTIDHEGLEIAK